MREGEYLYLKKKSASLFRNQKKKDFFIGQPGKKRNKSVRTEGREGERKRGTQFFVLNSRF